MRNSSIWAVVLVLIVTIGGHAGEPDTTGVSPKATSTVGKIITGRARSRGVASRFWCKLHRRRCVCRSFLGLKTEAGTNAGTDFSPPQVITDSIGMKLVLIPAGEFTMGSPEGEEDRDWDETQHRVCITKPFYLGVYEVTVEDFRQFVTGTGYKTDAERDRGGYAWSETAGPSEGPDPKYSWRNPGFTQTDRHPVVNVSWNDAVAYCGWLSRKEGQTYRLPTEAEWEYACRAGTTTRYSHGEDSEGLVKVGNVADAAFAARVPELMGGIKASDGYAFTSPVGNFLPNPFGVYDMNGNVWEWCADWYGEGYYQKSPLSDPPGPTTGSFRVFRGGSWNYSAWVCRSASRTWMPPDNSYVTQGFRVALVPGE